MSDLLVYTEEINKIYNKIIIELDNMTICRSISMLEIVLIWKIQPHQIRYDLLSKSADLSDQLLDKTPRPTLPKLISFDSNVF